MNVWWTSNQRQWNILEMGYLLLCRFLLTANHTLSLINYRTHIYIWLNALICNQSYINYRTHIYIWLITYECIFFAVLLHKNKQMNEICSGLFIQAPSMCSDPWLVWKQIFGIVSHILSSTFQSVSGLKNLFSLIINSRNINSAQKIFEQQTLIIGTSSLPLKVK